jgi:hypothetical protein
MKLRRKVSESDVDLVVRALCFRKATPHETGRVQRSGSEVMATPRL